MDDRIHSTEQLAGLATDYTDYEIMRIGEIAAALTSKYSRRANTRDVLDQLRDEALTKLAELGILATVDPAPCFHGQPPIIELLGKVTGHQEHNYGFDHEKKQWEVRKANELGEDFRGQKEKHNG